MKTCHDCNTKEGELHELGCDMERCPFCDGQLISCDCCYHKLGFDFDNNKPFSGLTKKIYNEGLDDNLEKKWMEILNKKGRIPYIILPNYCRRCLKPNPNMFMVSNTELNKLPIELRKEVLCK